MGRKGKPWYRARNVLLAIAGVVILVFGWAFWEVMKVYHAEPNPTFDARAALRALAEEAAGVSAAEGEAAWWRLAALVDDAEAVRADVNAEIDSGAFPPREQYNAEVDYSLVENGRTLARDRRG